jgi:hypothetical protein
MKESSLGSFFSDFLKWSGTNSKRFHPGFACKGTAKLFVSFD